MMRFSNLSYAHSLIFVVVRGQQLLAKFDPLSHPLSKIYICIHNMCACFSFHNGPVQCFINARYSKEYGIMEQSNIGSNILSAASIVAMSQDNSQSILKIIGLNVVAMPLFALLSMLILCSQIHTLLYSRIHRNQWGKKIKNLYHSLDINSV